MTDENRDTDSRACSGSGTKTFLLIHGSWLGAWCWHKVIARLQKRGHRVIAPDLPGYGRDRTDINEISLGRWREFVCDLLDAQSEPVVLVGHSRGGIVITEAAEQRPERIETLVYVAAFMPQNGESLYDVAAHAEGSELLPNIVSSTDGKSLTVRDEAIRSAFYGECSDDDVALGNLLFQPEPSLPSSTAVQTSQRNFGQVPRVYIECLRDRAMPLSLQRRMCAMIPCRQVLSIDTDHSPFLSRPDELVAHLCSL